MCSLLRLYASLGFLEPLAFEFSQTRLLALSFFFDQPALLSLDAQPLRFQDFTLAFPAFLFELCLTLRFRGSARLRLFSGHAFRFRFGILQPYASQPKLGRIRIGRRPQERAVRFIEATFGDERFGLA